MAGLAVVYDARMIKCCGQETGGLMALTAISIRWYMIKWLTHGGYAIVAGGAVTRYTCMVIVGAGECRGVMADGAVQRCGNMRRRFASSRCAVVTGGAVIDDTGMVEYRR